MDGLRNVAEGTFESAQEFNERSAGFEYNALEIVKPEDESPQCQAHILTQRELWKFGISEQLQRRDSQEGQPSTFRLIAIPRSHDRSLLISKEDFWRLFKALDLDAWVLYPVARKYFGFNFYRAPNGCTTFFVGTVFYALLWTFDSRSRSTNAIALVRQSNGLKGGNAIYAELAAMLQDYASFIDNPYLIVMIAAFHIVRFLDQSLGVGFDVIREVEAKTGHGAWFDPHGSKMSIDDITVWSRTTGAIRVDVSNHFRHVEIATSLLSSITDDSCDMRSCMTKDGQGDYGSSMAELKVVADVIQRQVNSCKATTRYLQERVKSQAGVLFALLTHEDARANIDLADKAKRDSSSMKTIAVMTMAFLPGTFFAALFALPSLQWDEPGVIRSNFWVYWAFTLPATLMVFATWLVSTNREWFKTRRQRKERHRS